MMDDEPRIIELPKDALPAIDELTGDLRLLAEVIGVALALKVAQVFCGVQIRLWGTKKWLLRWRNRKIREEYDAGVPARKLAMKYGIDERQIWNVLGTAEPVKDTRQRGLF